MTPYITKRFIILSSVLILIVSPVAALLIKQFTTPHDTPLTTGIIPATNKELLAAIKETNTNSATSQKYEDVDSITSVKRMHDWWYVVTVKAAANDGGYNPGAQAMLLTKFTNEPNSIRVVTGPGETFSHYNISDSAGVPYDVIDELNKVNNSNE